MLVVKLGRLILSLVGLAMIALSYIYNNLYFLAIAIVAFFAGLYLMGKDRKRPKDREKP